jgi:hypothetical protein
MRKRTIAITLSAVAIAALAGGAYAASRSGSSKKNWVQVPVAIRAQVVAPGPFAIDESNVINDAARRLHVPSTQLTGALKGALIDQINAAVKAGHLPAKLATVMKQRIAKLPGLPLGPGLLAPGMFAPGMVGAQVQAVPGPFGPMDVLSAAAKYLGLSNLQLIKLTRSGKTLAQVAKAQGKSTSGLEQAIVAQTKAALQKAVAAGHFPRAIEQRLLAGLASRVQSLVNSKGPIGPPPIAGNVRFRGPVQLPPWSPGMPAPPVAQAYAPPPKH